MSVIPSASLCNLFSIKMTDSKFNYTYFFYACYYLTSPVPLFPSVFPLLLVSYLLPGVYVVFNYLALFSTYILSSDSSSLL